MARQKPAAQPQKALTESPVLGKKSADRISKSSSSAHDKKPTTKKRTVAKPEKPAVVQRMSCMICAEKKPLTDFPQTTPTRNCKHPIDTCSNCIDRMIRIARLTFNDDHHDPPPVSCISCNYSMTEDEVLAASSPKTQEDIAKMKDRADKNNDPTWRWCLDPKCDGGANVKNPRAFKLACDACGTAQCVRCIRAWHSNESCKAFKARTETEQTKKMEEKTQKTIEKVSKPCPRCFRRIQLSHGCNHISCRCGHAFCYGCGSGYVHNGWCDCQLKARQEAQRHPAGHRRGAIFPGHMLPGAYDPEI